MNHFKNQLKDPSYFIGFLISFFFLLLVGEPIISALTFAAVGCGMAMILFGAADLIVDQATKEKA